MRNLEVTVIFTVDECVDQSDANRIVLTALTKHLSGTEELDTPVVEWRLAE